MRSADVAAEKRNWESKQPSERRQMLEAEIAMVRRGIKGYRENVAEEIRKRKIYIEALQRELARSDAALKPLQPPIEIYKALFGRYPSY